MHLSQGDTLKLREMLQKRYYKAMPFPSVLKIPWTWQNSFRRFMRQACIFDDFRIGHGFEGLGTVMFKELL